MNDEEIYDPMTGMKLWPMDENEKLNKGEEHMSIKTMEQALEALERGRSQIIGALVQQYQDDAITSLRQAIAAAEKQDPVAWMDEYGDVLSASFVDGNGLRNIPLYTTPPQREWVGLTDDEYQAILKEHDGAGLLAFYNLIEAKLRVKNGG